MWDTEVAENNCWARTFTTLVWAKHCLPLSHSFASPISLFLSGGNGCPRHGSTSRSRSCCGCQTGKGTPSATEQPPCTQDTWKSALFARWSCYHAQSTPAQSPLQIQRCHCMVWPSSHTYPTLTRILSSFTSSTARLCIVGADPLLTTTMSLLRDTSRGPLWMPAEGGV